MTKKIPVTLLVVSLMMLGSTCVRSVAEYADIRELPAHVWKRDQPLRFGYKPVTAGGKDFYVFIANDNHYPYSNIYLIVKTRKNDKTFVDTLEYEMSDGRGRWLGVKVHNTYENMLVFKWNVPVEKSDSLIFEVEPATRKNENLQGDEALPGIHRVGIVVKPHLQQK